MRSIKTPMPRRTWLAIGIAVALVVVVALGFTITSRDSFHNQGGNTTCADFKALTPDQRKETVIKLLEDRGQATRETNVTVALASSILYCQTVAKPEDPIVKMYSGGKSSASASATP